ncbi:MAG: phosphatidylglycerophosphatase A [Deltaproteobacteria bacterium]|nr:phosphatidylglycerophosphatase A [Deltaproteobacteria bacterium]
MKTSRLITYFVTCGRLGFAPKGPGTVTSLVSLIFWIPLLYVTCSSIWIIAISVLLTVLAAKAVQVYEAEKNAHDLSEVTIDEWIGMGLSLSFAHPVLWQIVAAFAFFRLFDIWKPIGVKYFDVNYLKGWGVILDDVVAGIYAAICLGALQWFFN